MNWRKASAYHWESDAGYTVCRVFVRGRWLFETWTPKLGKTGNRGSDGGPVCCYRGADDDERRAQAAAQRHASGGGEASDAVA